MPLTIPYVNSGSSFPASPGDGDLFYRTDRRIIYEYDATSSHWLSLDRKYWTMEVADLLDNTTSTGTNRRNPVFEDIYIDSLKIMTYVATTNDSSHFWTLTLAKNDSGGSPTTITSFSTNSDSANTFTNHAVSLGVVIDSSTYKVLQLNSSKTSTPGALRCPATLVVRAIG